MTETAISATGSYSPVIWTPHNELNRRLRTRIGYSMVQSQQIWAITVPVPAWPGSLA
jgi:hypothetical protein